MKPPPKASLLQKQRLTRSARQRRRAARAFMAAALSFLVCLGGIFWWQFFQDPGEASESFSSRDTVSETDFASGVADAPDTEEGSQEGQSEDVQASIEDEDSEDTAVYGPFLPPELQRLATTLHVEPGDTLTSLLASTGLSPRDSAELLTALAEKADPNRVPLGARLDLTKDGSGRLLEFLYEPVALELVRGERADPSAGSWRVWSERVPLEVREAVLTGTVRESLFATVKALSEGPELAIALASLFAWQIDFAKETRDGDSFRLVVEKRYRDGKFWDYGPLLGAQYRYSGGLREAYCLPLGERGRKCYDGEGHALERSFLRAPLAYSRVSSKFTHRRFHPVLKLFRPHEGVDYAAPKGTPVWTVADGRVAFAGRKGGNGNMVIVSHAGGIQTYYNHLSRYGRGIRRGAAVRQKQIVGYVGSTGLSTGPHLDFRIKRGRKFIDPLKADLPPGDPVPAALKGQFDAYRDRLRERLQGADALAQAPPTEKKTGG